MAIDISSISYFIPLLTYLVVFIVVYAASKKAELVKGEFAHIFISFIVATIFISAAGPRTYVASVVPWFVVLLISFFLIMALMGFAGFKQKEGENGLSKVLGIVLLLFFLVSGLIVFSSYFSPYLPWNSPAGGDPNLLVVSDWIFSPRVLGAILLIGITAVISFVIVGQAAPSGGKGKGH